MTPHMQKEADSFQCVGGGEKKEAQKGAISFFTLETHRIVKTPWDFQYTCVSSEVHEFNVLHIHFYL